MAPLDLFAKYDIPGPRYTSYPSVPFWSGYPGEDRWHAEVSKTLESMTSPPALYLHIPFCESLCRFCGCNKVVTRDRKLAPRLLEALQQEWLDLRERHGARLAPGEIHLGGGSPTWLTATELESLLKPFIEESQRVLGRTPQLSIEADPRTTTDEHVALFGRLPMTRVSLGVQDFDPEVLRLIHRDQPQEMVETLTHQLQALGIHINFDLVYGLPGQTKKSIQETMKQVVRLRPDRIAFYGYAHVPWKSPAQRLFEQEDLPSGSCKRELFELGREALLAAGYHEVGLDHFALPEDSLAQAAEKHALHRNFMGYTTSSASLLIGLGPSAVSECSGAYVQNDRNFSSWEERILVEGSAHVHGHELSERDKRQARAIREVLCGSHIRKHELDLSDVEHSHLDELVRDGILEHSADRYVVSARGRPFLRNIAMAFDDYLVPVQGDSVSRFSQTV